MHRIRVYMPAMIGAAIESYDVALYGYMAPVLVHLFFPYSDSRSSYFFYFFSDFLASIVQVFGAYFYGKMGDRYGRGRAIYVTILSTSIVTFLIGLLPTYSSIGWLATVFFVSLRMAQCFFLGGEYNGGAIYCLEHDYKKKNYGLISGCYCAVVAFGMLIAGAVSFVIKWLGDDFFRIGYLLSFFFVIATYSVRNRVAEAPFRPKKYNMRLLSFSILIASLFFGVLHGLPSRVFNVVIPLATGIAQINVMGINALFLFLYMFFLVFFGYCADKAGSYRIMLWSAIFVLSLLFPMTFIITTWGNVASIFVVKFVFMILAAAFIAPFHAWAQLSSGMRTVSIATSFMFGRTISKAMIAVSVLIYERTSSLYWMVMILAIVCVINIGSMLISKKDEVN